MLADSDSEAGGGESSRVDRSEMWKTRQGQACVRCLDGSMFRKPGVLGNAAPLSDTEVEDGVSARFRLLEIHMSREMSKLYVSEELHLPPVGNDGHYVVQLYRSGIRRTVVERANNILLIDEARANEAAVNRAMLEELTRWHQRQ